MTVQSRSPLRAGPGRCGASACRRGGCAAALGIDPAALGRLMPMHLVVGLDGGVLQAGPTLARLRPDVPLAGSDFFSHFDLRRPRRVTTIADLLARPDEPLRLTLRDRARTGLKGQAAPLSCGQALLMNLSFGISVVEAVRRFDLTLSDFAGTDLAVEMLFLVEAQSAVLGEARKFGRRLHRARIAAEEEASTDGLTGMKNRRALDHRLASLLEAGAPFALLHLDLDDFKRVNDTHGHPAGDAVLAAVARRLAAAVRPADMVARIGGDEFMLVLDGLTDPRALSDIARRVLDAVSEPTTFGEATIVLGASAGLTASTFYAEPEAGRLLSDADSALYASKRDGGGGFSIAPARSDG